MRRFIMKKEKDPEYMQGNRRNNKIATRCRVCGGQLLNTQEIKMEIHEKCNKDNSNMYVM